MSMMRAASALLLATVIAVTGHAALAKTAKPRLIVLTDIGGDPDDQQSLVRLLVHANEFDIEGLIASASGTPGELREARVRPDLIREQVEAYAKVYPNLRRHAGGFPTPARLSSVIKTGNPQRGEANVGAGHDTEGSNWIISVVDRADRRPVDIAIWGGPTELAQALWRVREGRGPAGLRRFLARLRVHAIGHQDDSGPRIVREHPELFYVLDVSTEEPRRVPGASADTANAAPKPDRRESAYRGVYLGGDESLTSHAWIETNVRAGHGPLGALYPDKTWTAPNPHGAMKEGDTPSFLYFLPSGLQDPAQPTWGGWGGRFLPSPDPGQPRLYRDAADTFDGQTHARATVYRWRASFQNAFAARMDWCVADRKGANHFPVISVNGHAEPRPLVLKTRAGAQVTLDARKSRDPDRNLLRHRFWIYREAGTYPGEVRIADGETAQARIEVPADAGGKTIHVILDVVDDGTPALTSHKRIVLDVH